MKELNRTRRKLILAGLGSFAPEHVTKLSLTIARCPVRC